MKRTPVTIASDNRTLTVPKGFSANKAERWDQRRGQRATAASHRTRDANANSALWWGEKSKLTLVLKQKWYKFRFLMDICRYCFLRKFYFLWPERRLQCINHKALVQIPRTPVNPNAVAVAGIYDPSTPVVRWNVREKSLKGQGLGIYSSKEQSSDPTQLR